MYRCCMYSIIRDPIVLYCMIGVLRYFERYSL